MRDTGTIRGLIRAFSLACLAAFVVAPSTADGQATRGEISGRITDDSGGVLPGVTVVVTNQETGVTRTLVSNEAGRYIASNLIPGTYEIKVELPGFRSVLRRNLQLAVGTPLVADFEMAIGEFAETVEVVSATPLVDVSTASLGGVVSRESIENLPMNARSFDQLATLQPGVVLTKNQTRSFQGGNTTKLSIRGARSDQNKLLLDGTDVQGIANELPGSVAGTSLGVDAVREFKVEVGTYSAEHGGAAGGVINVVTKSGTNTFSGTAFEYHRNDSLDERNFFDLGEQPEFKRNQFGFSAGGPIRRNRTFLFVNVEAIRENLGQTLLSIVPTAAARKGLLPTRVVAVQPAIVPYLALYPLPNGRDFGDGTAEFIDQGSSTTVENYAVARIDHSFSENSTFSARYTIDQAELSNPANFVFTPLIGWNRNQWFTAEHNYVISSSFVNTFTFGLNRTFQRQQVRADLPTSQLEELAWVPGTKFIDEGSMLQVSGLTNMGDPRNPRIWGFTYPQFKNTIAWTKGSHQVKAGGTFSYLIQDISNQLFTGGQYVFDSLEQLLIGQPRQFTVNAPGLEQGRVWRNSQIGWFVQDHYRFSDRMTIDMGLRHEIWTGPSEDDGKCANLINDSDPEPTVGCPLWPTQANNFAPRVGLAWDVTGSGRTSLRSGFGIFYDSMTAGHWWSPGESQLPFSARATVDRPPFPGGLDAALGGRLQTSPTLVTVSGIPRTMQYSLSMQHLLWPDTLVEIGYAGAQGRHNWVRGDMNQREWETLPDGRKYFSARTPRRNPAFGTLRRHQTAGESDYNGLLLGAKKRFGDGLQLQASYTWSKSMDVASGTAQTKVSGATTSVMDAYDIQRDRSRSDFHALHNFVGNFIWELPFGPERRWGSGLTGMAGMLLGGWQVSGVFRAISGSPVNVEVGFNRSRSGSVGTAMQERPDLVQGASQDPVLGTAEKWFDPTSFQLQEAGTFGNLGKNTVTGPNMRTLDMSILKTTPAFAGTRLQVRAEIFNVFNRVNLGAPANTVFNASGRVGSAGRITDTSTAARQMQLAVKLLW